MRAVLAFILLATACGDPESPEPSRGPDPTSRRTDADCEIDADCVLMPWVTCCGECPPAPPFEAAPRDALDAVLIESEQRCALDRRECEPPVCDPVPAGCWAKAACEANRCVVKTDGCR